MNTARCGFVCLWLCLLLSAGGVVPRRAPVGERVAAARDEPSGPAPGTVRLRTLVKGQLVEELASGRRTRI